MYPEQFIGDNVIAPFLPISLLLPHWQSLVTGSLGQCASTCADYTLVYASVMM